MTEPRRPLEHMTLEWFNTLLTGLASCFTPRVTMLTVPTKGRDCGEGVL